MDIETKYLIKEKDRHGNVRLYYRKKPGPRIRIRAEEGTPEFFVEYARAASGLELKKAGTKPNILKLDVTYGSLVHLVEKYYQSLEFKQLGESTKQVRRLILNRLCRTKPDPNQPPYGEWPVAYLEARHIRKMRDDLAEKPEAANGMLKALRQVFTYGVDSDYRGLKSNVVRDVKTIKSQSDGFHTWSIDEVRLFEAKHSIGTMQRLAFALLLYTGQRRSDVVSFGPASVKDGWLHFTQVKNSVRKPISMSLPIIPALQDIIDKTPGVGVTFVTTSHGRPYNVASFGNWFAKACEDAGVPGRAHGLRKAAASRLAELGCTDREIMAVTGHTTSKEVDRYTKGANQRILASSAMDRLSGGSKPRLRVVGEN